MNAQELDESLSYADVTLFGEADFFFRCLEAPWRLSVHDVVWALQAALAAMR